MLVKVGENITCIVRLSGYSTYSTKNLKNRLFALDDVKEYMNPVIREIGQDYAPIDVTWPNANENQKEIIEKYGIKNIPIEILDNNDELNIEYPDYNMEIEHTVKEWDVIYDKRGIIAQSEY